MRKVFFRVELCRKTPRRPLEILAIATRFLRNMPGLFFPDVELRPIQIQICKDGFVHTKTHLAIKTPTQKKHPYLDAFFSRKSFKSLYGKIRLLMSSTSPTRFALMCAAACLPGSSLSRHK